MISELIQNPIGIFLAVLSIVLAIVLWKKGRMRKQFCFFKSFFHLVGNKEKYDKVKILYDGKDVDNITITNYTVWNCGNAVINKEDMADDCEIKIKAEKDTEILDAQIIVSSDSSNKVSCRIINRSEIVVDFSYLSEREGFVIQIVHSKSSELLSLNYKIKGGLSLKEYKDTPNLSHFLTKKSFISLSPNARARVSNIIASLYVLGCVALAIYYTVCWMNPDLYVFYNSEKISKEKDIMTSCIAFWILAPLTFYVFSPQIRDLLNYGIPHKLKQYSKFH